MLSTDPTPAPEHTFHQLVDERAQVVGLLLLPLAHLDDVSKVLADVLQQLGAHLHFSLEESEQGVLRWFAPKAERREEGLEEDPPGNQPEDHSTEQVPSAA